MLDLKKVKDRKDLSIEVLEGGLFGDDIRIVRVDNDLLFSGRDCALILEYKTYQNAIKRHVLDDAKIKLKPKNFGCPDSGHPKLNNAGEIFITEQGLYDLIGRSNMPKAEDFRRWVGEVLSSIRKKGFYDVSSSKYKKTIKSLPGYHEDKRFKDDCTSGVIELSKSRGEVTGVIWNKIVNVIFDHFGINIKREITKFTKRKGLDRRPNIREYLDIAGYQKYAYIAMEILHHDEHVKTNPERLVYVLAMCNHYYEKLTPHERQEIKDMLLKMFDEGILKPAIDYEAVESYIETDQGIQRLVFKE